MISLSQQPYQIGTITHLWWIMFSKNSHNKTYSFPNAFLRWHWSSSTESWVWFLFLKPCKALDQPSARKCDTSDTVWLLRSERKGQCCFHQAFSLSQDTCPWNLPPESEWVFCPQPQLHLQPRGSINYQTWVMSLLQTVLSPAFQPSR